MKKIFSLKLTIYLCLFYSLLTTLLPAETYKFGIKNFCEQVSIKDLLIEIDKNKEFLSITWYSRPTIDEYL